MASSQKMTIVNIHTQHILSPNVVSPDLSTKFSPVFFNDYTWDFHNHPMCTGFQAKRFKVWILNEILKLCLWYRRCTNDITDVKQALPWPVIMVSERKYENLLFNRKEK